MISLELSEELQFFLEALDSILQLCAVKREFRMVVCFACGEQIWMYGMVLPVH